MSMDIVFLLLGGHLAEVVMPVEHRSNNRVFKISYEILRLAYP